MAKASDPPAIFVVLDSFAGDLDGEPVVYRKGEAIHPDDPALKKWPASFGPFVFPHPVKRETRVEQATAAPGEKRGA